MDRIGAFTEKCRALQRRLILRIDLPMGVKRDIDRLCAVYDLTEERYGTHNIRWHSTFDIGRCWTIDYNVRYGVLDDVAVSTPAQSVDHRLDDRLREPQ